MEGKYPILEFDDSKIAKIAPASFVDRPFQTDKLIITFFPEVMNKLEEEVFISLHRTCKIYLYGFWNH